MKELDKARIQPITLQLIQKYSFTRKFKSQISNAQLREEEDSTTASETASV